MKGYIMDSSKKILLTTIGIAILICIVSGVTFAFFNYTRIGGSNTIRVGRISFVTRQTSTINLVNVFPISSEDVDTDTDNVDEVVIEIEGDTDYVDGIEYLVSSVDSSIYTSSGIQVPISLDIEVDGLGTENDNYFTARDSKNANIYKQLVGDTLVGDQMLLVGYIKKNTTNGTAEGVDGSITIKAYFDKDKILVSDTYDGTESGSMGTTNSMAEGKTVITTNEWNALGSNGLSFKIKVEANEGIWVIGSLEEVMRKSAVMDNINSTYVNNSTPGIDFGDISSDENGNGVYTLSSTANEDYPIMYYRGEIEDNNVIFGNKCWKAVRTTDTGGVKLLYNGYLTNTYEVDEILDESDYNNVVTPLNYYTFDSINKEWSYTVEQDTFSLYFSVPTGNNYSVALTGTTNSSSSWEYTLYKNEDDLVYDYGNGGQEIYSPNEIGRVLSTDVLRIDLSFYTIPTNNVVMKLQVLQNGVPLNREDYTIINDELDFDNNSKRWVNQLDGLRSSNIEFSVKENGNYLIVPDSHDISEYYVFINGNYNYNRSNSGVIKLENITTTDRIVVMFAPYSVDADPESFYVASAKFVMNGCESTGGDATLTINDNSYHVFNNEGNTLLPGGVGYMYGEIANIQLGSVSPSAYYGSGFTWDGTNYKLTDPVTTLDNYHHYSCNSSNPNATCSTIRYFFYYKNSVLNYLNITNGDGIEEVLEKLSTNTHDSNAKSVIDSWYGSNMTLYTNRLEDTIWCNDRSIGPGNNNGFIPNGGDLTVDLRYGPLQRSNYSNNSATKNKPSLECINKNDRFTVNNINGNRALTYPVALLAADEIVLAGSVDGMSNYSTYLNDGEYQWTLSPYDFTYNKSRNYVLSYDGNIYAGESRYANLLRPAISIKPGQLITKGTGTVIDPYVIE